ncbi:hypothetical protein KKB54_02550 [bacterium]|nr:hypothetical protein [bacterium]MBU0899680.1 hypothetical protein [bacterium]MBU1152635.1 hypothetical protein [bacterium]MBU1781907.1 hypothetical protein [bacterium]
MNKNILSIILIGVIYFTLTFSFSSHQVFFSGDNAAKFIQIQNLIKHHWEKLQIEYPGEYLDSDHKHFPLRFPPCYEKDKKFYLIFPIAFSFFSSFLYQTIGYFGLYILPLLSSVLTIFLIYQLFWSITKVNSFLIILVAGFCTPIFFYSSVFWEHSLAMLLSFLAFYLFFKDKDQKISKLFISGLIFGISLWFRLEIVFFFVATIVSYFLIDSSSYSKKLLNISIISLGLILATSPLLCYNYTVFGNLAGAHASINYSLYETKSVLYLVKSKISDLYHLLFDTGISRSINLLFLFLAFLILSFQIIPKLRRLNNIILMILILILFVSAYIACLCGFSRIIGLLVTSPFLIIIVLNIPTFLKKQSPDRLNLLFYTSLFYIFFLLTPPGFGDKQWGPRFLLPLYPLLIILSLSTYYSLNNLNLKPTLTKITKKIFILLCLISFLIQGIGIYKNFKEENIILKEIKSLKDLNSQIIITDVWWLPQECASIFYEKCFFWVRNEESLHHLLRNLKKRGVESFTFSTFLAPTSKENIARTISDHWYQIMTQYGYGRERVIFTSQRFENSLLVYKK